MDYCDTQEYKKYTYESKSLKIIKIDFFFSQRQKTYANILRKAKSILLCLFEDRACGN